MSDQNPQQAQQVQPQKSPERKFIHDMNTPLAIAIGALEIVLDNMRAEAKGQPSLDLQLLEKAFNALDRLTKIMQERRALLIEQEKTAAEKV